jgi:hypothetical protein
MLFQTTAIGLAMAFLSTGNPRELNKPDHIAVLVGSAFLRAVGEKDIEAALPLCAQKVSFNGKIIEGKKKVALRLKKMLDRVPPETRFRKVIGLSSEEMYEKFGPPPKRISTLSLKKAVFVLGRLYKGGLIVILDTVDGRYKIIGLTV